MQQVLVDTSALIALFIKSEQYHVAAQEFFRQHSQTRWIILSTVFSETVTWVRSRISPRTSIQIGQTLREDRDYIQLSEVDDAATWEAFCQYDDKLWSYTDCSILVMAKRLEVFHVVSFDADIRQMAGRGIICLP